MSEAEMGHMLHSRIHAGARRRGYTLIELLMVVALLGLAASVLIPYMSKRTSLETQAAVRTIIADLHFAQADALAHQEYRRVHFYDDGRGYCLIRITNLGAPFDPSTADYLFHATSLGATWGNYIVDFAADHRFSGVSIQSVSIDGGNNFITYDELGGTINHEGDPGTGGTIVVTSDQATYEITIAPFSGKLTVQKID